MIETMIDTSLIEFADFLEAASKTPSFLKQLNRANVKVESSIGAAVFETNDIWFHTTEYEFKSQFESKNPDDEKLVTLKVLDIPNVHHFTKADSKIFRALSETED